MSSGWIKIHRQIEEWEWYTDANTFRLFFHLLIKANHKDKKWRGMKLKKGSVVTGLAILSVETKMSIQNVRTALKKLESTNEITSKTSNKGTIIQVVRFEMYQETTNDQQTTNKRPTNDQQTTNKPLTTNKNDKNEENDKNEKNINGDFSFFSVLELGDEIKKQSTYLESFMMNRSLDKVSMEKIIDEFVQYKIQIGEDKTTSGSFKKHLTNWINKKDFRNMRNGRKRPQIQIMPS